MIRKIFSRILPLIMLATGFSIVYGNNSEALAARSIDEDKVKTESVTTPTMPENPKPSAGGRDSFDDGTDDEDTELDSCEIYSGHINWLGYGKVDGDKVAPNMLSQSEEGSAIGCLQGILNIVGDRCDKKGRYIDDCYAATLLQHDDDEVDYVNDYFPKNIAKDYVCLRTGGDYVHTKDDCVTGYFYFDAECNPVNEAQITELCGSTDVATEAMTVNFIESSPISLLWSENSSIEAQLSFVRFSLNPNLAHSWYEWRASSETPLLVYDPEHKGQVVSAFQLFGNWTFGGKKLAYRTNTTSDLAEVSGGPWGNGYQALATLDTDLDGKVSGTELEPLALWFDNNQDAVSQEGEVKPLIEMGVTALFFKPDRRDEISGSIFATLGYTRAVDSKTVHGTSVDWFSRSATTQFELVTRNTFNVAGAEPLETEKSESNRLPKDESTAKRNGAEIGGLWAWYLDVNEQDADKSNPQGYLVLDDSREKNEVRGYSFVERGFKRSPELKLKSLVSVLRLQGSRTENDSGELLISFSSRGQDRLIESEATLAKNGRVLVGKSTVRFLTNGRNRKIQYTWRANKLLISTIPSRTVNYYFGSGS